MFILMYNCSAVKTFLIQLKKGLQCRMEAENETRLRIMIQSGHYKILPIRGQKATKITESNIETITEIKE